MAKHSAPVIEAKPNGQAMTADVARAAIDAEKAQRAEACQKAINAALKQYRCTPQIVEIRINGQVQQVMMRLVAEE